MFLWHQTHAVQIAGAWIGEDLIPNNVGTKRPDAFVVGNTGEVVRALEYGGIGYTKRRIASFHQFCVGKGWPYDLF